MNVPAANSTRPDRRSPTIEARMARRQRSRHGFFPLGPEADVQDVRDVGGWLPRLVLAATVPLLWLVQQLERLAMLLSGAPVGMVRDHGRRR